MFKVRERGQFHCSYSDVFITFFMLCTYVSMVDFEQMLVCWEVLEFLEIPYIEINVTYKHGGFMR